MEKNLSDGYMRLGLREASDAKLVETGMTAADILAKDSNPDIRVIGLFIEEIVTRFKGR